jgi:hypothetical protein
LTADGGAVGAESDQYRGAVEEQEERKMERSDEEPEREGGGRRELVGLNARGWLQRRRGLSMAMGSLMKVRKLTLVECGEGGGDGDVR